MIILTKKKIVYTFGIILLFILVYAITVYNTTNISRKQIETVQTVALPVNKKVIIIDAGHGKPDEGAQSSNRNYRSSN